ncbi:NACHT domain-containing protein [Streptomyces sp. NPDC021093]|uniref:NACHT domain-containing protein n=1 Tax=Streptomyces sp. NPDC021093 TaxID=3365112 RepID=UPI0037A56E17
MGVGRNRSWQISAVYFVLALGGMSGALWIAHRFALGAAATAASLLPTLAPLFLSWVTYRSSARKAAEQQLGEIADQLARAVHDQWETEARVRRVNDPYPLRVSWRAVPDGLAEEWPLLRSMAVDWPGGPAGDSAAWARTPEDLAGTGAEITELFADRVPTRRLLVLGPPGAGKTVLLVRLLLGLLALRDSSPQGRQQGQSQPVPVLFPLASWNPEGQDLYAWLSDRLAADHPGLAEPAPARHGSVTRSRALLEHHLVLPILDGLDEIPFAVRGRALSAINQALPLGRPVVLSSRLTEYRDALRPLSYGVPVKLSGAAGIELLPLAAADAAAYLRRDAGGAGPAADRWAALSSEWSSATPMGEALRTPLMLFLARTIYNPRPGEQTAALPHPGELCDARRFPDRDSVEAHLFSAFVPAAYRSHPGRPCRWTPQQAHAALVFLARHLQRVQHGSPDLTWWQLHRAVSASIPHLLARAIGSVAAVVLLIVVTPQIDGNAAKLGTAPSLVLGGLIVGYTLVLPAWLSFAPDRQPVTGILWTWNWPWLAVGLGVTALVALAGAATTAVIAVGLGLTLAAGFGTSSADPARAVGPQALWARDRLVFWQLTLAVGIPAGGGPGVAIALHHDPLAGLLTGLGLGLWAGLTVAFSSTVWGTMGIAHLYLALRRRLPRDFMGFLRDAHEHRGVLRQAGAVYQFRHIDLQRHLAG